MKSTSSNGKVSRRARLQSNSISSGRWAAYLAAGVASTVALAPSAEAEVHYSGLLNYKFWLHNGQGLFPLGAGTNLSMRIGIPDSSQSSFGHARVVGANGAFAGHLGIYTSPAAYALPPRVNLSRQPFPVSCRWSSSQSTQVCYYSGANIGGEKFQTRGKAFIGFEFTNGSGTHYGWARVRIGGAPDYKFWLIDYAWADAGEPLKTGQTTSSARSAAVTKSGSLGLLSAGAAGLKVWRGTKVADVSAH